MKTSTIQKIVVALLTIAGFACAVPAHAVIVSYTVDGVDAQNFAAPIAPPADAPHVLDGQGYSGDAVALGSYTGTFDLKLGTSVQQINSLLWSVNWTYGGTATDFNESAWSTLPFDMSLNRAIHIGDASAALAQSGTLTVAWDNDYLNLNAGNTTMLTFGGYNIAITPLAAAYNGDGGATTFDTAAPPWNQPAQAMYATFVVTEAGNMANAPEPGSIAAMVGLVAISLGGPVASRLRRK